MDFFMNFVRNKLYFLKNTFKQFPKSDVILVYAFFVFWSGRED